jgi:hypothetical protein
MIIRKWEILDHFCRRPSVPYVIGPFLGFRQIPGVRVRVWPSMLPIPALTDPRTRICSSTRHPLPEFLNTRIKSKPSPISTASPLVFVPSRLRWHGMYSHVATVTTPLASP